MSVFDNIDKEVRYLINMYTTARQFRNAIASDELLNFGKKGFINKIFPFVVNKTFSCEVYLKMIIKNNGDTYENVHNLLDLYRLSKIQSDFESSVMENVKKFKIDYNLEQLNKDLENLSSAFVKWRYIYEYSDLCVSKGVLNIFNDYLDNYCKKIIKEIADIDMDKYPFI